GGGGGGGGVGGGGGGGGVAEPPGLGRDARRHGPELLLAIRRQPPEVGREVERVAGGPAHAHHALRPAAGVRQRRADRPVERPEGRVPRPGGGRAGVPTAGREGPRRHGAAGAGQT